METETIFWRRFYSLLALLETPRGMILVCISLQFWEQKKYQQKAGEGCDIATYFRFAKWLSHAVEENMTVFRELGSPEKTFLKISSAQLHIERVWWLSRFNLPRSALSSISLPPLPCFHMGILSPRKQCAGIWREMVICSYFESTEKYRKKKTTKPAHTNPAIHERWLRTFHFISSLAKKL